jgi:hypothetical protein
MKQRGQILVSVCVSVVMDEFDEANPPTFEEIRRDGFVHNSMLFTPILFWSKERAANVPFRFSSPSTDSYSKVVERKTQDEERGRY